MVQIKEIELDDKGMIKDNDKNDHTLYKMPNYNNYSDLKGIKNKHKLDFLRSRCMNLDIYPPQMIKLLLDGDYKGDLERFKPQTLQFINELLEKKIPYTKLGIQTKLYKLIKDVKRGEGLKLGRLKKPKKEEIKEETKEEIKEESDDEIEDIETLENEIVKLSSNGHKQSAFQLLNEYLNTYDPEYHYLLNTIKGI